ncbi:MULTISPECIES: phage holin [Aerococcus]|uniref:Holin n=1 Tax=Aerococcus tenax TaxID=3078812 RepID=A0A329NBH8_9LACT|nr:MULTISPECIES: phage holin [Aerococcus]MDL5184729.1 phage holin [Aerococcus mictus]KAA9239982.1 holin [Aerococcus urinae]MDK6372005.1 phage holin [Aerococcus urinae]MDK7302445.1 phage holin [Aerococcus urinae]MDK7802304.1 phage holin [Aerococcus urinae]
MDFKMKNSTYDTLKWIILIVAPALMTLVSTIGGLYGWPQTEVTVAVIGAVTTFAGAITGVSSKNYNDK